MIFDLETFTVAHVVLSLAGIGAGFVIMWGLLTGRRLDGWTALFLATRGRRAIGGRSSIFEGQMSAVSEVSFVVLFQDARDAEAEAI